ncbi:MAG: GspE/PulE family protein [Candidatus Paceibacterota bacterium]|jgi:type IV pilus assembly protein PilB
MSIRFDEDNQKLKLDEIRKKEKEDLAGLLAAKSGLPYINLQTYPINPDALKILSEEIARKAELVIFDTNSKRVSVAVLSPTNEETKNVLADLQKQGYDLDLRVASIESLNKAWERYGELSSSRETEAGSMEISSEEIASLSSKITTIEDVAVSIKNILSEKKTFRTTKIIEIMLAGALAVNASDVHLEPEESYARLRYRLDGVLHDILEFDNETFNPILSRIKLVSGLKLNIDNKAQDGRFTVRLGGQEIEIRTSILPGAYSESIVLRVLNPKSISVPMEELGIEPRLLKILEREISKPTGMLLTTGPTGSGKTTTLYAFLKKIHTPEIKIITIENPIEYHLPGIVQTQADEEKGYNFIDGLRSALRQDPDVIMIGEIRDSETAGVAINSSLTGHLVFSTLHTNTAAGTFPRLIDLGVNSKILTSAINIAMAQRLVRKLCPSCKKEIDVEGNNKILIDKIIKSISSDVAIENTSKMWTPVGCEKCNKTGYNGRIGIYEAILSDDILEKILQENPSEREIKKATASQGILDMKQDGILKVLAGTTSLDELKRVVDLESE